MQTKIILGTGKIVRLTVIEIGLLPFSPESHKRVETLRAAIADNKTFMNFKVYGAPGHGNLSVNVETNYDASEKRIRDSLTFILFQNLTAPAAD